MLHFVLAAILAAAPGAQQTSTAAPASTFETLERALADAMLAKDAAALARLLDAQFVMRGSPNRDREAWIDTAVTGCWGDEVDLDDVRARMVTSDVALVTLRVTYRVDPATCKPAIVRSLLTDTWRRDDTGAWTLVSRHASAPGGLDTQYQRLDPPPPPFEGRAQVSYLTTRGNTRTGSLAGGVDVTWRARAWTITGAVNGLRADADGEPRARRTAADLRASRKVRERLSLFVRAAGLRDRFAGIDSQLTFNAGASLRVPIAAAQELDIDLSAGYLDEVRVNADDKKSMTGDLGARYRARLNSTLVVTDAALMTADLSELGDWRLKNELALDITLMRWLSIRLAHALDYRHRPIEGFRGLDQSLATSLVTRF